MMLKNLSKQYFLRNNLVIISLLTLGTIAWSLTMVKSGACWNANCEGGMGFWGANGHDAIWHISLINSLAKGLLTESSSFEMPVLSGMDIKNYHLGFDLLIVFLHKITNISIVNLYFQVVPPIIAFLVGLSTYLFVKTWKKSHLAAIWATFFVYFGGELSWIFNKGESTFWSQQAISTLINPPFALSLVFIFLGLYFLVKRRTVFAIVFFGLLLETKAYAGVLVLGALFLMGIWEFLRENQLRIFKIFFGASLISLVLFLLLNKGSENLFLFEPFWFLKNLFNLDRFSVPRLASAITNYQLAGNTTKLYLSLILAFIVFWVGNMWTRLFKEIEVLRWLRHPKEITKMDVFVTSVIIAGALIPLFFVQKGTPWNTIQFFYYSLTFSAVLAGVGIKELCRNKPKKFIYILSILIVLLTIPTTLRTLVEVYLPQRPPAKISKEELSALSFLRGQDDGVVLTYPYDSLKAKEAENNPPRPLYLYDSTAYVSAISAKTTYLEDEVNLNIMNFDWKDRRENVETFLNTLNQDEARKFLSENNIKYVYWVKPQRAKLGETQLGLIKIFENNEVDVFKVE